uniref:DUF523 domain-containing protein n=1 Tax=uncultured prokaryote TaxID=198431 RepID=A0A0H5PY87_9ZZZZ|nr:hypothetical protein [uncultured prokaryote]
MKKLLLVSHCLLNTAAKVRSFQTEEMAAEEELRLRVLRCALEDGVQLIQLPCMEFIQYGARRWGHTKEQFDTPFFRQRCREALTPVVLELEEYLSLPEEVQVLGVLGIDGSPSCGVKYTCSGPWGGEFSGREDLKDTLAACALAPGMGVMMAVLTQMLRERGMDLPVEGLFAPEPQRAMGLLGR